MKKLRILLLLILFAAAGRFETKAQPHLVIIQLDSFPFFPGDTAFESQVYDHIHFHITNTGNVNFFGNVDVFIKSQSVNVIDTLYDEPFPILVPIGDTEVYQAKVHGNPNFRFRSTVFAAGDNIIVVWPYSAGTQFDIYNAHIFYSQTVGIEEPQSSVARVFPNPVSQILRLEYLAKNKVEQVRIYDVLGIEMFSSLIPVTSIDVSEFRSGIYFLEFIEPDGNYSVKKILITNN